ncbi:maleylpyruvate isomerase family mycothiol-dependent enzyme [Gordonia sp. NPDC003585]|uniref:maleylpyruvate isomerase family mycothiol-dependent enzyme n=1 Tax=Gordonia sp. NPDC003585 TaxID=3154275 RepID=UPI0033B5C566
MTPELWLAAINEESEILASTPADDMDLAVPACPGWTVHDLLGHVGAVRLWVADRLNGTRQYRGYDGIAFPDGAEVVGWYADTRDQLVAALTSREPDEPVSTFVGERTVRFWYRRQAHELEVHRYDLESALRPGKQSPIKANLAADGVDEWLEVFAPRFIGKSTGVPDELVGRSLHLHSTDDPDAEWYLELTPEGIVHRREHAKADAALRGPTSDLLLALWHRRSYKDLDIVGDESVVEPTLGLVHVT